MEQTACQDCGRPIESDDASTLCPNCIAEYKAALHNCGIDAEAFYGNLTPAEKAVWDVLTPQGTVAA